MQELGPEDAAEQEAGEAELRCVSKRCVFEKGPCLDTSAEPRLKRTGESVEERDKHEYLMPLAVAEVTAIRASVHSQLPYYWHD